jgi:hypothetical protein
MNNLVDGILERRGIFLEFREFFRVIPDGTQIGLQYP